MIWMTGFILIVFNMQQYHAFFTPPLCSLYGISAQTEIALVKLSVNSGSAKGNHLPISLTRNKFRTRERPTIKVVEPSINNHIVGIICLLYTSDAADE